MIEGVPAKAAIERGAQITIINGKLFGRIAIVCPAKKE